MMSIWAFVDYENTGGLEYLDFKKYDKVLVFCGAHNQKINLGDKAIPSFVTMEFLRIKTTGANNLDFHIAYYLGKMSETEGKNIQFDVVTNDKGFDGVIAHICETGRICNRVGYTKQQAKSKPKHKLKNKETSLFSEVLERLKASKGRALPQKKIRLENWICAQIRDIEGLSGSRAMVDELLSRNIIKTKGEKITYLV